MIKSNSGTKAKRDEKNGIAYSRIIEIETADLSQSHVGVNLSQFQTDCLLRIHSSTEIINYLNQHLKLYQHWQMKNIGTLRYLRPS